MCRPRFGDRPAAELERVLETKAGPTDGPTARVDTDTVGEPSRGQVADVGLERQRLDTARAERRVPAVEAGQVLDTRDLEPDEIDRVVRDRLGVGLGEANGSVEKRKPSTRWTLERPGR